MGEAKRKNPEEIEKKKKKFIRFGYLYKLINPNIATIDILASAKRRKLY